MRQLPVLADVFAAPRISARPLARLTRFARSLAGSRRIARASWRNAAGMSAYEKCALRPLGFGSTNRRAPWTVAFWKPGVTAGGWRWPITRHSARYMVTPTNATISGR
jgi:hypothetical protein